MFQIMSLKRQYSIEKCDQGTENKEEICRMLRTTETATAGSCYHPQVRDTEAVVSSLQGELKMCRRLPAGVGS